FSNPIDAEIIGNRIYVIEWGGGRGLWEIVLPQATIETAVAEAKGIVPEEFALAQNFPNPFNASTTIAFQLALPSQVELSIYSISGQRVRTLISTSLPAGHHRLQWDGRNERGEPVASGTYLYQLLAGDFVATRQLMLLK
ncbi:MAG: T9SS type A sorting domain-containing protein, partial [Gemmatimonadetes bacterium]|nr:T9SS type A sorting domain-containing protein [Gemmatimonadota bacterium]